MMCPSLLRLVYGAFNELTSESCHPSVRCEQNTWLGKCVAPLEVPSQNTDHKIPKADKDMTHVVNEPHGAEVLTWM